MHTNRTAAVSHAFWGPDVNGNFYSRSEASVLENGLVVKRIDTGICHQSDGSAHAIRGMLGLPYEAIVFQNTYELARKRDL